MAMQGRLRHGWSGCVAAERATANSTESGEAPAGRHRLGPREAAGASNSGAPRGYDPPGSAMNDAVPHPDPGAAAAALSHVDRESLRRGCERAIAEYGPLALPLDAFAARVAALATRHWRGQGVEPTAERVTKYVASAALHDLYLASACDAGDSTAWNVLATRFRSRLEGFAAKRGIGSAEAEALVQDLFGDLASPPPNGASPTLLGTFDGSGSLAGWLSIVVIRRIAARSRGRKMGSLDTPGDAGHDPATPSHAAPVADPLESAVRTETAARFATSLDAAWSTLTSQERLALVAKHRDGFTQRRVGDLLGLGEARVSRIVSAAVRKLSDALRPVADGAIGGDLWRRLEAAVARQLASPGRLAPPTRYGTARLAPGDGAPRRPNPEGEG